MNRNQRRKCAPGISIKGLPVIVVFHDVSPSPALRTRIELHAEHEADRSHEDAYVAVRDAFDALRRQLENFIRIRRGDVKTHASRNTDF